MVDDSVHPARAHDGTTVDLTLLHATVLPIDGTRLWHTDRQDISRLRRYYSAAIDYVRSVRRRSCDG